MPVTVAPVSPIYRLPVKPGRQGEGGRRTRREKGTAEKWEPALSIITIVLNGGDALRQTMQSVLQWPRQHVEYIIIDGGSTDQTVQLLQEFDERVEYWVSEPDKGISDAFNKGLALCRGEIVGIINSGDWYEADAYKEVLTALAIDRVAGVLCGNMQFWDGMKKAYRTDAVPALLSRDMTVAHPACFVRRSLYQTYGGFSLDYRYAMDYELLLRFFVHDVIFVRTGNVLANMQHDGVAEMNWRRALQETHRARQQYIQPSFFTGRVYLGYLIGRRYIRFFLQWLGFSGMVGMYRQHLAAVRKTKTRS